MLTSKLRLAALVVAMAAAYALPQAFNIDIDIFGGPPTLGNGAPSPTFGAAAGQMGHWNRLTAAGGQPEALSDLAGNLSGATMLTTSTGPLGQIGFAFAGNTGDYALLLNDASVVAPTFDGGTLFFDFDGLKAGAYRVVTYAVATSGAAVNTPVHIEQAQGNTTQVVTGPMPGNAFSYLITHSLHEVVLQRGNSLRVSITQPPNVPTAMQINGFQIVMVPELGAPAVLGAGVIFVIWRLRRSH